MVVAPKDELAWFCGNSVGLKNAPNAMSMKKLSV